MINKWHSCERVFACAFAVTHQFIIQNLVVVVTVVETAPHPAPDLPWLNLSPCCWLGNWSRNLWFPAVLYRGLSCLSNLWKNWPLCYFENTCLLKLLYLELALASGTAGSEAMHGMGLLPVTSVKLLRLLHKGSPFERFSFNFLSDVEMKAGSSETTPSKPEKMTGELVEKGKKYCTFSPTFEIETTMHTTATPGRAPFRQKVLIVRGPLFEIHISSFHDLEKEMKGTNCNNDF